jgi:hypothetical protein
LVFLRLLVAQSHRCGAVRWKLGVKQNVRARVRKEHRHRFLFGLDSRTAVGCERATVDERASEVIWSLMNASVREWAA